MVEKYKIDSIQKKFIKHRGPWIRLLGVYLYFCRKFGKKILENSISNKCSSFWLVLLLFSVGQSRVVTKNWRTTLARCFVSRETAFILLVNAWHKCQGGLIFRGVFFKFWDDKIKQWISHTYSNAFNTFGMFSAHRKPSPMHFAHMLLNFLSFA